MRFFPVRFPGRGCCAQTAPLGKQGLRAAIPGGCITPGVATVCQRTSRSAFGAHVAGEEGGELPGVGCTSARCNTEHLCAKRRMRVEFDVQQVGLIVLLHPLRRTVCNLTKQRELVLDVADSLLGCSLRAGLSCTGRHEHRMRRIDGVLATGFHSAQKRLQDRWRLRVAVPAARRRRAAPQKRKLVSSGSA